jgi:hypothetical protein
MQDNNAGAAPQMQQNATDSANGTNPQTQQAPSAPNTSLKQGNSSNKIKILGILVAVVILIAVCLVFFKNSGSTTMTNSTSGGSKSPTTASGVSPTTSVSSNGGVQNLSNGNGGGPGKYYLSKSEAASLMGSGGKYDAFYQTNPGSLYGNFSENVTALWIVGYGNITTKILLETLFQSPKANSLYSTELSLALAGNETVGAVNATLSGLKYSYVTFAFGNVPSTSELIGYKNGIFVSVESPYTLNQTKLASVVAGDIP